MTTITEINRDAWNSDEWQNGEWSAPVTPEQIAQARQGQWSVILTPLAEVPREWFGELQGKTLLGLASGGGQQMPIFAAAGATVTSFDNSDQQLAKDTLVAERCGLDIPTVQGDMADLSAFADESFDIIFHPISNCFVPNVHKVWQECFRVLKPGGRLLAGFCNPAMYLFDYDKAEADGKLEVVNALPYADVEQGDEHIKARLAKNEALEFSHSLDSQIGGQLAAGFVIHGMYEDRWTDEAMPLNPYMPTSIATLAIKPA